jgi:hypothetical protein
MGKGIEWADTIYRQVWRSRVADYHTREVAKLTEVYVDPIIRDFVQRDAPVTDWSLIRNKQRCKG